jgi:hypothetical protein
MQNIPEEELTDKEAALAAEVERVRGSGHQGARRSIRGKESLHEKEQRGQEGGNCLKWQSI